jgi:DNA-nicking Smr family endonuclease
MQSENENVLQQNTEIELGDELDLHCFAPSDTKFLVTYFIEQSFKKGFREIRIIHGKGKSVKKREVHSLLSNHPAVESFSDDRFNWGATIAVLKVSTEGKQEN